MILIWTRGDFRFFPDLVSQMLMAEALKKEEGNKPPPLSNFLYPLF